MHQQMNIHKDHTQSDDIKTPHKKQPPRDDTKIRHVKHCRQSQLGVAGESQQVQPGSLLAVCKLLPNRTFLMSKKSERLPNMVV